MMPALPPAGCPVTNILHDLNHSLLCRDATLGKGYVRRCSFRLRAVLREDTYPRPAPKRCRMGHKAKSGVSIYDSGPHALLHSGEQDTTHLLMIRLAVVRLESVTIVPLASTRLRPAARLRCTTTVTKIARERGCSQMRCSWLQVLVANLARWHCLE